MLRQLGLFASFIFALLLSSTVSGQDSVQTIKGWKVASSKTGGGKYTIKFSLASTEGWELYAPKQDVPDLATTQVSFRDSSIVLEPGINSSVTPSAIKSPIFDNANVNVFTDKVDWMINVTINGTVPAKLQGVLQYSFGKKDEFYSGAYEFVVPLEGGVESTTRIKIPAIDIKNPVNDCGDDDTENKSLLGIFLLGLAGGFIALLTPCVFPLIPLTVSFFTKKSQSRRKGMGNALLYGFFIFLIYVLLSIPFHLVDKTNPEILNNLSTNVWLNIFFFAIFVVFAISFFGYFEIGLPGGLANKVDARSGIGNIGGIFFMALTLAIVSFSCTGPILGSLLAGASNEGAWPLTAGLAGFGFALALPFALFAMFPHWLQSLPKSGGWLTSVKVVLGFLELAMAIKFLSNADLVKQWGLLPREVFIGFWVIIGICIVLYLFGKIRFPHGSPVKKIGATRWAFIIFFIAATVYLVPGITNTKYANLSLISGFPPPLCYSVYEHPVNCKEGFEPLRNYEQALEIARKENKPVLIDFTGWACVNCRRMEEKVWTDPLVDSLMRKEFVVVSLYVDERRALPLAQQIPDYLTKSGSTKSIVTVGDKWATFQSENFNAVSQPQYAILDGNEKALTKTKTYTPDPKEFAEWLLCGQKAFKK